MRLLPVLSASVLLGLSVSARADSTTYDVTGSGILSGTVAIDSIAGTITDSELTVTTSGFTDMLTGSGGSQIGRTGFALFYNGSNNDAYELLLTSPDADGTLTGYTGGEFQFSDALGVADTSGSLVASTPEPSSFALLGTGLLGVAGVVRKRFA